MNILKTQFSQLPFGHHAYGIESNQSIFSSLEEVLPKEEFSYIVHKQYDTLKINDARMIKSLQIEKTDKASLFVLECTMINHEAQNALLKVLEEPTPNTYFILVCPSIKKLLPTLQSRLDVLLLPKNTDDKSGALPSSEFLAWSLSERFEYIKKRTDKKSESPLIKLDVLLFLDNLELIITSNRDNYNLNLLEVIFQARSSLHAKGASNKMILEMIAIHV
jgi:DNA polymerase-3 subunit delta'